ncbi:vacuolar ATPase assembly integral membrane protein vma21 [Podochytrium sp. JEL0797]|nr:vacuolar ATPase assembly integral membrane protein vma21 [Podochytrium sp. JEL0797]
MEATPATTIRKRKEDHIDSKTEEVSTPSKKVSSKSSRSIPKPSNIAIPSSVLAKLAFFSIAMFTLPIGVYFYTIDNVFNGESLYSAICAAVTANVVLIGYVVVAFMEDSGEDASSKKSVDSKKTK